MTHHHSSDFSMARWLEEAQGQILLHIRKLATLTSWPLCNFLLNEHTCTQDTTLQGCLYGSGISTKELDQRCVIAVSKNVPDHQKQSRFLALHQLFGSFLLRQIYHGTHVSCIWADWFGCLVHQGYFTIFVLGASDKSVPVHECHANLLIILLFIFSLVVTAQTMIDDIFINLQNCGLFYPTDISYGLYTTASCFRQLIGTVTMGDLRAGLQTHTHSSLLPPAQQW